MAKPNLPEELAEQVELLKEKKVLGLVSLDEFVRESVRINLERYLRIVDLQNQNRRDSNDK